MFIQKIRTFAQFVGLVVIGLLMIYGAVAAIHNVDGAFAANARSAVGAPAAAPQLQPGAGTVPAFINYQGTLRDPEGNAMNGVYAMTFRIYGDVSAPTTEAKWTGEYSEVTVREGHFSVVLGDSTPLPADAFTSPDRFIGITVEPYDEMVPRQRFASVPYAVHAEHSAYSKDADLLDGKDSSSYSQAGHAHNSLSGPNDSAADALWVSNTGYVGVGTKIPTAPLHITQQGGIRLESGGNTLDLFNRTIRANGDLELSASSSGNIQMQSEVNLKENLRVDGQDPIIIKRLTNIGTNGGDVTTGISSFTYHCVATGWSAQYDTQENDSRVNMVWTYVKGGVWHAKVDLASHNNHDQPDVDVVCFSHKIATFSGGLNTLDDPN